MWMLLTPSDFFNTYFVTTKLNLKKIFEKIHSKQCSSLPTVNNDEYAFFFNNRVENLYYSLLRDKSTQNIFSFLSNMSDLASSESNGEGLRSTSVDPRYDNNPQSLPFSS